MASHCAGDDGSSAELTALKLRLEEAEAELRILRGQVRAPTGEVPAETVIEKRIEDALRASESRMAAIFAQAAVGLSELSLEGRFLRVNDELCRMLQQPRENLIGRSVADVTHPEDLPATRAVLTRLTEPATQVSIDKRYVRPDGSILWANSIVTRLKEEPGRPATFLAVTVDLTARRQAEQTLRSSEERFRSVFEHAETGIAITERQGRVVQANPAFCSLLGYTEAELRQIHFMSLIHPDDRDQNLELVRQLVDGEIASFVVENRYVTKSGRLVWVRKFVSVLHAAADVPTHFVVLVADITERRAAEEQLRLRTARLQLLSEALGQLLISPNPEPGMHQLFSTVAAHLGADTFLLYRFEERSATLHLHASSGAQEQDIDSIRTLAVGQGLCGVVAQTRQPLVLDDLQRSAGPQDIFFRQGGYRAYAGQPLLSGQRLLGTISFARRHRTGFADDEREFIGTIARYTSVALERSQTMRALAESEGRFRHMADHAPVMVWVTELDGACSFISKSWLEFTGQTLESALGQGWIEAVHPEDRARTVQIFERAMSEQIPFSMEYRLRGADGRYRWAIDAATPRRDGRGEFLGFVGSVIDITGRKNAEAALAQAKEALEHANRDLDRTVAERTAELRETITELESFSYTVSHDLKAPLRAMSCFSDLLLSEHMAQLNEEGRDMLRRIAAAARRMEDLTNDLLNYTRISQGQLHVTNVQLEAVLDHVMDLYPAWRERADIIVVPPLQAVRGHPTLVGQILANLIGNAMQFVAPGVRPRVIIRTEIVDAADRPSRPLPKHRHLMYQLHGNARSASRRFSQLGSPPEESSSATPPESRPAVRIWVEDNGIGIEPQYHEKIFSIFQQLPGPDPHPGTGVGLAIVAKAVERMGGYCGVESALNEGSRFWVELDKADPG